MQGQHGKLQPQPGDDKGKGRFDETIILSRKTLMQIKHIQCACGLIKKANTDDKESRANRAHNKIVKRRGQRPPIAPGAHGHQRIGRQRRYFQKHKYIKRVPGHGNADETRQT